MQNSDTARAGSAQDRRATSKTRWKISENGNRRLSFYDLSVTVFPNTRRGGWTVSVATRGSPPAYSNYATEAGARAAAELIFYDLKASGKFKAPPSPPPLPLRQVLESVLEGGRVRQGHAGTYVELSARLERKSEKADLFHVELPNGRRGLLWVPHSQGAVVGDSAGRSRLIVTRWWLDRLELAR